ncbi:MAG: hypothetical protein ACFB03_05930 [Paracoccaceae bacterium]
MNTHIAGSIQSRSTSELGWCVRSNPWTASDPELNQRTPRTLRIKWLNVVLFSALLLVLSTRSASAADLEADLESLEACVLESGASGQEDDCIGILHEPCKTLRCYHQELALWRLILLDAAPNGEMIPNRRMQVGTWQDRVRIYQELCEARVPTNAELAINVQVAACARDAHAHAAINELLKR